MTIRVSAQILVLLSMASLAAWGLAYPIGVWVAPLLDRPAAAVVAVGMGIAWAAWCEARIGKRKPEEVDTIIRPATLARAFLPILTWQAIALTARLDLLAAAFVYYHFVSLPLTVIVCDLFATHAVYWMTVSSTSDDASKSLGRRVWTSRLFGSARERADYTPYPGASSPLALDWVFQAVSGYRWGALWLIVATLAPLTYVAIRCGNAASSTLGLQLVAGTLFGLLGAVILRSGGDLHIITRFFLFLVHWFYYGWKVTLPAWLFRSPCGRWRRRHWYLLAAVGLLAIPLASMTAHSCTRLLQRVAARQASARDTQASTDDVARDRTSVSSGSQSAAPRWLWIAPTVLVVLTIPATNFCLIGILLTGNVISAYHGAFEGPLGVPPRPCLPDEEEDNQTSNGEE